jgi:methyltransferase-like protein/SAM-dependent methyltransferase
MQDSHHSTYDSIPYTQRPFPSTHPGRLATVGTLLGLDPPDVRRCRVLEIGCGRGGNIVPMAEQLPNSTFLGIDLSAVQVREAQQWVENLGFKNVEVRTWNIEEIDLSFGSFDYILCHGVYSWVPPSVQQAILRVCSENLSPNGIAYVSFNTRPGWNTRGSIRDMISYHTQRFETPQNKIVAARELLAMLQMHLSEAETQQQHLKKELALLKGMPDSYLFHEYLETHNEPIYFHEFVDRLKSSGLQYLADSDLGAAFQWNRSPGVVESMERLACDDIEVEQYSDFLNNRMFRQSLICHASHTVNRQFNPLVIPQLYVESFLVPLDLKSQAEESGGQPNFVHRRTGKAIRRDPLDSLFRIAFDILAEFGNAGCKFSELMSRITSRTDGSNWSADSRLHQERLLANELMRDYLAGNVAFHTTPANYAHTVSLKPSASRVAKSQIADGKSDGDTVTTLTHHEVRLSRLDRFVLCQLDGTKTIAELAKGVESAIAQGDLESLDPTQPAIECLKRALVNLVRMALLVS